MPSTLKVYCESSIKSFKCISQDAFCHLQSYCKLITQSSCSKEDQKQLLNLPRIWANATNLLPQN